MSRGHIRRRVFLTTKRDCPHGDAGNPKPIETRMHGGAGNAATRVPGSRSAVALYARTRPGDPDNSLEVQVEALHEYARRHRLETVRVYFDTRSARSQFHEMMVEATGEDPPLRRILVHDMGRLSRWADGLSALRDRLEANGVTVVSVTGGPAAAAPHTDRHTGA